MRRWGLLAFVVATMGCNQIVGNNDFTIDDSPSAEPGDGDGDGDGDTGGTNGDGDGDTGGTTGDGDGGGGNNACPTTFGSAEFGSGCFE